MDNKSFTLVNGEKIAIEIGQTRQLHLKSLLGPGLAAVFAQVRKEENLSTISTDSYPKENVSFTLEIDAGVTDVIVTHAWYKGGGGRSHTLLSLVSNLKDRLVHPQNPRMKAAPPTIHLPTHAVIMFLTSQMILNVEKVTS